MEYHELVENELLDQLNKGDYVIASSQPATVSPLAATPNKKKKKHSDDSSAKLKKIMLVMSLKYTPVTQSILHLLF